MKKNLILGLSITLSFGILPMDDLPHDTSSQEARFINAIFEGRLNEVLELIAQGVDINMRTANSWTPIHWALPHPKILKTLIDHGANIHGTTISGFTPLHLAARDYSAAVKTLLFHIPNPLQTSDELLKLKNKIITISCCLKQQSIPLDMKKKIIVSYLFVERKKIFSLKMLESLLKYVDPEQLDVLCLLCPYALLKKSLPLANPTHFHLLKMHLVQRATNLCAQKTQAELPLDQAQEPTIKQLVDPASILINVEDHLQHYQSRKVAKHAIM
jgi:Ankyrin repeats (3 copies)